MKVTLLSGATVTNGQPSGAPPPKGTVGVPLVRGKGVKTVSGDGFYEGTDDATVVVEGSSSGATTNVTVKLWGYVAFANGGSGQWVPMGTAASGLDADRGKLNNGTAIGTVVTNTIQFSDKVYGLGGFTAAYAEIVTINGTGTAVSVYLVRSLAGA